MSKICICVLTDNALGKDNVCRVIQQQLASYGLASFFEFSYIEPFLQEIAQEKTIIFSIADTSKYDNCEMFLLPDNCFVNGKENTMPFGERFKILKALVVTLLKSSAQIDIFVGDSGLRLNDFKTCQIVLDDFENVYSQINCVSPIDLHIIIRGVDR